MTLLFVDALSLGPRVIVTLLVGRDRIKWLAEMTNTFSTNAVNANVSGNPLTLSGTQSQVRLRLFAKKAD